MDETRIVFKKILIAEDSAINQIFMQRSLGKICGKIDIAENGLQAVQMVAANEYDLILMDIFMPEMDGYEAATAIRKELNVKTPIIAVTSVSLPGEEEKCVEAGMNGYIVKPFTSEVVKKLITERGLINLEAREISSHVYNYNGLTIDLNILYQLGDDTSEHVGSMVNLFVENMAVTVKKMAVEVQEQQWSALQKTAHYAKSSLSVVQVNELFELAKEIDLDCRALKNIASVPERVQIFEQMFYSAREFLNDYVNRL